MADLMVKRTAEQRFWANVQKTEGCWLWTGSINAKGYGWFSVGGRGGRKPLAHRFAYELLVGPIPEGKGLDHECHNRDQSCLGGTTCRHRRCVRPEHLIPRTSGENTRHSATAWSTMMAAKTHCVNGHEFTEENLYRDPDGNRQCRTCRKAARRRAYVRERSRGY